MSEIEGMASMLRLEKDLVVDVSKLGWRSLVEVKKIGLWMISLQYSKTEGATNAKNLIQRTQGNVIMAELPDECQKDFEKFCKKNGILCSKMYDFNREDGNKQYMFDGNMADMVYQSFAREMEERYGDQFAAEAENLDAQRKKTQQDILHNEAKKKEFESVYQRMKEGHIENETDNLARAMGYQGKDDPFFADCMKDKCAKNGTEAYIEEAKLQMEQWENRANIKKRELKELSAERERVEKKMKNPVHPISKEDYINTGKFTVDEFEENLQRMAADEDCPVYEKTDLSEALRQDAPIPREREELEKLRPEKVDYIYDSKHSDTVITRSYYKDMEDGREVGCYHVLKCDKEGQSYSMNDRGLGKEEYQNTLQEFLGRIGMDADSRVTVIPNRRELDALIKVDRQAAEKPPIPREALHPDSPAEGEENQIRKAVEEEQKKELEEHAKEQSMKEYSEAVERYKIFQDPSKPDLVRVPVMMEDGNVWMVEAPKESITLEGNGQYQIHFNGSDRMRAYQLDAAGEGGKESRDAAFQMITGNEFKERLRKKGLPGSADHSLNITINRSTLLVRESEDSYQTRVPGMYGENAGYLFVPKADAAVVDDGKTILTSLEPEKDYTIYGKNGEAKMVMSGTELYNSHYDPSTRKIKDQKKKETGKDEKKEMGREHAKERHQAVKAMKRR